MRASPELSEGSYDHKGSCEQRSLATEEDVVVKPEFQVLGGRLGEKESGYLPETRPGNASPQLWQEPPCSQAPLSPAGLSHHLGPQTVRQHVCAVTAAVVSPHSSHRKQTDRLKGTEQGQSRLSNRAAVCFHLLAPRLPHL